jgi:hypothetical protein
MNETNQEDKSTKTTKPLVFISHDTRDAELAEAFSNLLKTVSAGVLKSFRSSDKKGSQGIEYGIEWYPEIIRNIQDASDVVCLLTENSIDRPWILFEAGMAKGKLDTKILGIALGVQLNKAISGPFAVFQNCGDDEDSLVKLVLQLVDRIPNSEPDEETIKFQVKNFKTKVDEILKNKKVKAPNVNQDDAEKANSSIKLFEEIKVMFQDLPTRIENNVRIDNRDRRRRKFHPVMIDEICHINKNSNAGILMALSLFKETPMPWIYDIGLETLKNIKEKKTKSEKIKELQDFEEMIQMTIRNPMMREINSDSKEDYMMMREMPMILINNMRRILIEE